METRGPKTLRVCVVVGHEENSSTVVEVIHENEFNLTMFHLHFLTLS